MRIKIVVIPLKRKELFVYEENILGDSLEKLDISVDQECFKISSEKKVSFYQDYSV